LSFIFLCKHSSLRFHSPCELINTRSSMLISIMSRRMLFPASRAYQLLPSRSSRFTKPKSSLYVPSAHRTSRSRTFHHSSALLKHPATPTSTTPPTSTKLSPQPQNHPPNPTLPAFNLFHALRDSRPAVRYTVYAGLALMATVESTFWLTVIKAKFFPASSEEEKERAEDVLNRLREAIGNARGAWMRNYGRYYGRYVWGVGER
jgi:hypothetical protein